MLNMPLNEKCLLFRPLKELAYLIWVHKGIFSREVVMSSLGRHLYMSLGFFGKTPFPLSSSPPLLPELPQTPIVVEATEGGDQKK